MGGSMGSVVGEVFTRASDIAAERGIPLVSVAASGGARMQENVLALMQMAKTVCAVDLLRESGVPYVSVLSHPTTGGVIASFAALGDFVVAEPDALLSFAGPRVVQETTRETLPADFGRSESSLEHGLIDAVSHATRAEGRARAHSAPLRRRHARADRARRVRTAARHRRARAALPAREPARRFAHERRPGMNSRLPTPFRGLRRRLAVRAAESDIWDAVQLAREDGRPYTLDYVDAPGGRGVGRAARRPRRHATTMRSSRGSGRSAAARSRSSATRRAAISRSARSATSAWRSRRATPRPARVFALADRLGFPVVTMIDTPGAYPGVEAEQARPGRRDRAARCWRWCGCACRPWPA